MYHMYFNSLTVSEIDASSGCLWERLSRDMSSEHVLCQWQSEMAVQYCR